MAGLDGRQRARAEQLGVPGSQGTQAGIGPSVPPPQYPRASPQLGTICPPRRASSILRAASYLSGSGSPPSARDRELAIGNWQN